MPFGDIRAISVSFRCEHSVHRQVKKKKRKQERISSPKVLPQNERSWKDMLLLAHAPVFDWRKAALALTALHETAPKGHGTFAVCVSLLAGVALRPSVLCGCGYHYGGGPHY